jgi:hypothetical protein
MSDFETLLARIAQRPGMYVGVCSLPAVSCYLDGYCHAMMDAGKEDPMIGFSRWIDLRYQIFHAAWHWTRILLHEFGSDEAALAQLPGLFREFSEQGGPQRAGEFSAELRRQLVAKFGRDYHEPETTATSVWEG